MTHPSTAAPAGSGSSLVRIAITSPDILAQIRQVFAGKNLDVEIVRLPYIEVAVRPVGGGGTAADGSSVGAAAHRLDGPEAPPGARTVRRLCAEYRLNVIEVGDQPQHGPVSPGRPPRPSAAADPAAAEDPDPDDPDPDLSQRQHEVMALVSRGVRNAEIAARLHLREKTVKNHINRIFRSLGADSRVEAVLIWQNRQREGTVRRAGRSPAHPPRRRPGSVGTP